MALTATNHLNRLWRGWCLPRYYLCLVALRALGESVWVSVGCRWSVPIPGNFPTAEVVVSVVGGDVVGGRPWLRGAVAAGVLHGGQTAGRLAAERSVLPSDQ